MMRLIGEKVTGGGIGTMHMLKAYTLAIIKRINRKRLTVGRNAEKRADVSKLKYCPCCDCYVKGMVYNKYHWDSKIFNPSLYLPEKRKTECPNCGAYPRHRLLMWYFKEHVRELKNSNGILYFACERVVKGWLADNGIKYVTADLYAPADLKLDMEDTGLDGDAYDYIVCNHVLEHVNDFKRALKEIYRILAPNGTFICSFPILDSLETYIEASEKNLTDEEKIEQFGQRDHLRIFGRDSKEILQRIGFEVETYDKENCPENIVLEDGPGRYDKTLLFICRKIK